MLKVCPKLSAYHGPPWRFKPDLRHVGQQQEMVLQSFVKFRLTKMTLKWGGCNMIDIYVEWYVYHYIYIYIFGDMFVSYKQSLGYKDNKWSAYQKMTTSKLSLPGLRRGLRSWKKEVDSGEGHKSIHTYRIYRGKVAGWHLQKTAARNGAKRHQDGHWLNISMWCLFCICWCISSTYGTCFPVKPLPLVQSQCLLVKSDKSACVLVESPCLLIRSPHFPARLNRHVLFQSQPS